jgi:opacity protein-like surface antigen
MKNKKTFLSLIFCFVFVFVASNVFGSEGSAETASNKEEAQLAALDKATDTKEATQKETTNTAPCRWLKEVGILSGYAVGSLKYDQPDYEIVPMILRLGFDLNPFINKFGWNTKGILEFELEPFINTIISPNSNVEVGSNFLVKYALPLTQKIYPYFEGGLGMLYMSQHTLEQGSQYNFLPQAGGGIMYFLKDNLAISAGYRYRHLSNNSLAEPNGGIDVNMALVGLSIVY